MSEEYPEFSLRLPNGGPTAHGRLLEEKGPNGSQKFMILAGSPGRAEVVPSFALRVPGAYRLREDMIKDGVLAPSTRWPGYLEVSGDFVCNSPSTAVSVLVGGNRNGFKEWKSPEGHPLVDYLTHAGGGGKRAWLVRGSNVAGRDLVQTLWLAEEFISLAGGRLRTSLPEDLTKDRLRAIVEEDYEGVASYSQREVLVDEIHDLLKRVKPGDTVCSISQGMLFIGEITGDAQHVDSGDGRSNLRRPVDWNTTGFPYEELPEELQQKLSIQRDVVDLTNVLSMIETLGLTVDELIAEDESVDGDPSREAVVRRELELPEPTGALAGELLLHDVAWLREQRDLLADERQLIFYGPPGTGKTYLALKLAEFLGGGPEQIKLVQFHPSYAYEDFFEGFRPQEDPDTGEVAFRLVHGPLRELADLARRPDRHHIPHFLVIDEINRANLAKVFGELYFLLEYRTRTVRLTYSGDDFGLPSNLFIIGTMNTADRSIALVDAAMRRRFAFVELSPRTEPTKGLLHRWLKQQGKDLEPALLLDELNRLIHDPDFRVGPSYLMKKGVYRDGGLERTWRTKILPLLEEYHYGESIDIRKTYGLDALRAHLGAPTASA